MLAFLAVIDYKISVLGFFIGFFVGLTGMGAGALMTPMLIILGTKPTLAIGSDLMYAAITKIFGAWMHWKQNHVDMIVVMYLAIGSIPASFVGVAVITLIRNAYGDGVEKIMARILGYTLLLMAVFFFYKAYQSYMDGKNSKEKAYRDYQKNGMSIRRKIFTVGSGVLVGFLVGITSVGAGTLTMVIMTALFGMTASRLVGTDVFHGLLLAFAAAFAHLSQGNVDFGIVGTLLIGSIPGVILGSRLTIRIPEAPLRVILAVFVMLMGFKLIS